jgi:hypothetical protein
MEDVEDIDDPSSNISAPAMQTTRIAFKGKDIENPISTEEELEREKWKNQIADHKQQVFSPPPPHSVVSTNHFQTSRNNTQSTGNIPIPFCSSFTSQHPHEIQHYRPALDLRISQTSRVSSSCFFHIPSGS